MLPLFPSNLDPTIIIGSIMNGSSSSTNEENEIIELEQQNMRFLQELERIASDIPPLGKHNSVQNNDSDSNSEDGSNDEESDSDDDSNASNEAEVTVNY